MTTPAERVRASEARKISAGGRRLPGGILSPEAAACLDRLLRKGYGASVVKVIERALKDANLKS